MSEFSLSSMEEAEYVVNLPYHLAEAGMIDDLHDVLIDFDFLEYKISNLSPQSAIEDYDLATCSDIKISENKKSNLKLIQGSIRLSTCVLERDKTQLVEQISARLLDYKNLEILDFINQAVKTKNRPWLKPLNSVLSQPTDSLVRTIVGHLEPVRTLAITPDDKWIISGAGIGLNSKDNSIKIWNLETGKEQMTLNGHDSMVRVMVLPNLLCQNTTKFSICRIKNTT
jgi:WD40 repeat protein